MALELLRRVGRAARRGLRRARLDRWLASAERRRVLALVAAMEHEIEDTSMNVFARTQVLLALHFLRQRILNGENDGR